MIIDLTAKEKARFCMRSFLKVPYEYRGDFSSRALIRLQFNVFRSQKIVCYFFNLPLGKSAQLVTRSIFQTTPLRVLISADNIGLVQRSW